MTENSTPYNTQQPQPPFETFIGRLHPTSIIVTTALHIYLCLWADMAHTSDEAEGWLDRAIPKDITDNQTADFLTASYYARLYHLMRSVKSARMEGRVTPEAYSVYADYFNSITDIADAIHGRQAVDESINNYKPKRMTANTSTSTTHTLNTNAKTPRKTSQMPSLLDEDVNAINEPIDSNIYPCALFSGIFNRRTSPPAWCVISNGNYEMISIVDWLTMDNPPTLQPFVDPFDGVEGY